MDAPKTLQEAIQIFSDYDTCRQFMVALRWPDGKVLCPRCGSEKVGYLKKARVYVCYAGHAQSKFSLKVGTVFEDSPIPLEKWLPAVWLLATCKNGISSYEIHRDLGVSQKTAWFMLHRIRTAMKSQSWGKVGGSGSTVEADETVIGGKLKFMHKSRKDQMGMAGSGGYLRNKTVVMGVKDRDASEVRATVIQGARRENMIAMVREHVQPETLMYTDAHVGYDNLGDHFPHEVINHMEAYVRGRVHTNGIENFWSLLKRGLNGTYVAVEPFHLQRYVDEQVFRFNNRATKDNPLTDADRFQMVLSQIVGKRLTYAQVTGKVGETIN